NVSAGIGSGGMITKIEAAKIAYAAGCATVISLGNRGNPLGAIEHSARATWIVPPVSPLSARQAWLGSHLTPEGELKIDAGAASALKRGSSLLPVGVVSVTGRFEKGAALQLIGPDGAKLGKGVSAYSSSDIDKIKGLKTDETEAVLGYRGRPAIIHRDDLVLSENRGVFTTNPEQSDN
ncbi:MAG: PUA domain-containing protein, partial [Pseudomonadota bacterium]